jgi:hypothetical protein
MVEGLTYIEGPPSMNLLFCSLSLFSCSRCNFPLAHRFRCYRAPAYRGVEQW